MNPFDDHDKNTRLPWLSICGGLFFLLGLCLFFTNPSQRKYEEFATEQLIKYARENLCQAKSGELEEAIKSQMCTLMLETGKHQVPKLIGETTQRSDYLLLSMYHTNLYIYSFEVIGVFNNFYVIGVDKIYNAD
jgi:hypothetical protein